MLKRDFTLVVYQNLLQSFIDCGYTITTAQHYLKGIDNQKYLILRHDIDKDPLNALETAKIENRLGVKGSYYFRIVKNSNNPSIIKKIAELGHEIGYHYEDLAMAKGDYKKAITIIIKI